MDLGNNELILEGHFNLLAGIYMDEYLKPSRELLHNNKGLNTV